MTTVEVFIDDKGGVRPVGQAHFTRNRGQSPRRSSTTLDTSRAMA